jgi:hypothetical protein
MIEKQKSIGAVLFLLGAALVIAACFHLAFWFGVVVLGFSLLFVGIAQFS